MKRHIPDLAMLLVMLTGIGIFFYPTVSSFWNSMHESRVVEEYSDAVNRMSREKRESALRAACAYNRELLDEGIHLNLTDTEKKTYEELLNIDGDGVMGTLEIPKIRVRLPVYHGTLESTLAKGAGHLAGSSLPVGGPGTHAAISGHRGLPSARLFTDLAKMENGDRFTVTVLGKSCLYEVDQIVTILPDDLTPLAIEPGRDYCTLITCTPYGINTHRLLVRGRRIYGREREMAEKGDTMMMQTGRRCAGKALRLLLPGFVLGILLVLIRLSASGKAFAAESGDVAGSGEMLSQAEEPCSVTVRQPGIAMNFTLYRAADFDRQYRILPVPALQGEKDLDLSPVESDGPEVPALAEKLREILSRAGVPIAGDIPVGKDEIRVIAADLAPGIFLLTGETPDGEIRSAPALLALPHREPDGTIRRDGVVTQVKPGKTVHRGGGHGGGGSEDVEKVTEMSAESTAAAEETSVESQRDPAGGEKPPARMPIRTGDSADPRVFTVFLGSGILFILLAAIRRMR